MTISHDCSRSSLIKKGVASFAFLFFCFGSFSQSSKADSIRQLLSIEQADTTRVKLMWQLANTVFTYNPDTAIQLSQNAFYLAKRINDIEGESRSMGILANTFRAIGNYPRALDLNLQKLQLEEKRNKPRNLASVLMNIGIVYVFQEEYDRALEYYSKADSVITNHDVVDFKYNIALNIGDVYDRLNKPDSAHLYFSKSLEIAKARNDGDLIGTSLTGLGHTYLKIGNHSESLTNYQNGITLLKEAEDDEVVCEATLGIANLYQEMNNNDSAVSYATFSFDLAKKDGFLSKQLEAAEFLMRFYRKTKNFDNAFAYSDYAHNLNDSLNSRTRIRETQILSSNEQFRQRELEESRRLAKEERRQQLQMLLIGVFIPGLFLLTLSLRKAKIHVKVIRLLGILSLLFFFEYLTLLLHPTVANLTDHTPVYEILIFVVVAAFLIPAHHRIENWFIQKLVQRKKQQAAEEENTQPIEEALSSNNTELPVNSSDEVIAEAEQYLALENQQPVTEELPPDHGNKKEEQP